MHRGTIVPLVTPLEEHGSVCDRSVKRLIGSVHHQVTALMPALSSGEGWKLSEQQWQDMIAYTQKYADGLPVLAGIQCKETADVIARARAAMGSGVDAAVVMPPCRAGVSQEEIYEHYHAIRMAAAIPLFIYNEAAICGHSIELETLVRICRLPDVVGIKESSGSPELTRALVAARTGVPVFQGWENLLLDTPGVDGFIGPLANIEPALSNAMLTEPSAQLQREINAACEQYGLFLDDWYVRLKKELRTRGIIKSETTVEDGGTSS